jgi:hypothetical protein
METDVDGVLVGLWLPNGWDVDMDDGLVIAEDTTSPNASGDQGIIINCFVPKADAYPPSWFRSNYAWAVLAWVMRKPEYTDDMSMTEPVGFDWDDHRAAYYLFTTEDGARGVVLAVEVPGEQKVVGINVSAPIWQSSRIRGMLPELLNGVKIGTSRLDGAALDMLPDALPFPHYDNSSNWDGHGAQAVAATASLESP